MKNTVFLTFCLMIVTALVSAHALFRDAVSPVPRLEARMLSLERQKREAEFQAQILAFRLADFQQHVATLLPEALKGQPEEHAYPLRQLASVGGSTSQLKFERASSIMERAKAAFRKGDYEESIRIFQQVISRHPESAHVPEAHFLLAEAYFQNRDRDSSVQVIENMIDRFPENDLTGFALLRLGHIYELQDRLEDASDIYKAVLTHFKNHEISKQATLSLQAVAL